MKSGSLTLRQYRTIDLILFMIILFVSQFLISKATMGWFPDQLYVVSPVAAVTAIVMMRWGVYGGIHAALGGIAYGVICGGSLQQTTVYGIGNIAALAALLYFRMYDRETVRNDTVKMLIFAAAVQALMLLGRAVMALIMGFGGEAAVGLITTDALSFVFTLVVLWIAGRVDGLFEEQRHYLLRVQGTAAEGAALDRAEIENSNRATGMDSSEGGNHFE